MDPMPPAEEVAALVRRGEASAVEVVDHCLSLASADDHLRAFVHLDADLALAWARDVDRSVADARAGGRDPGPLCGVPIGVKDLEDLAGHPTSQGSRHLVGRVAEHDSINVARLRAAGAVPIGKTAAPELGILNHTSSLAWGTTRNPWDPTRTPGGSSGGSAAAVSAGLVPMATASDGGGSTRTPAAYCGLVGLKPTYGRIPRLGPDVAELATDGVLATTVADVALHLDVAAGPDPRVRTSLPADPVTFRDAIDRLEVAGLRARWSPDLGTGAETDPHVVEIAGAAARRLADAAGLRLDEQPLALGEVFAAYLHTTCLDAWTVLEPGDWPGCADRLEPFTVDGMRRTEARPLPSWARSVRERAAVVGRLADVWREVDVLLCPTTALPPFPADEPTLETVAAATPFTMLANLSGGPAVSVPAGVEPDGLPVGLQIVAPRFRDDVVLRLARLWELTQPWPRLAPPR